MLGERTETTGTCRHQEIKGNIFHVTTAIGTRRASVDSSYGVSRFAAKDPVKTSHRDGPMRANSVRSQLCTRGMSVAQVGDVPETRMHSDYANEGFDRLQRLLLAMHSGDQLLATEASEL